MRLKTPHCIYVKQCSHQIILMVNGLDDYCHNTICGGTDLTEAVRKVDVDKEDVHGEDRGVGD